MPVTEQRVEALKQTILTHLPSTIDTTAVVQLEEICVGKGRYTDDEFATAMSQLQEQDEFFVHNGWVVNVRRSS